MTRHRMRERLKTTMVVDGINVQSFTIPASSELQTTTEFANKRALHPFRRCLGNSQVSTLPCCGYMRRPPHKIEPSFRLQTQ